MIKRCYKTRLCPVLERLVKLLIEYRIMQPGEKKSFGGVIDCDHIEKCGVKIPSNNGYDHRWKRCPFNNKQFK